MHGKCLVHGKDPTDVRYYFKKKYALIETGVWEPRPRNLRGSLTGRPQMRFSAAEAQEVGGTLPGVTQRSRSRAARTQCSRLLTLGLFPVLSVAPTPSMQSETFTAAV